MKAKSNQLIDKDNPDPNCLYQRLLRLIEAAKLLPERPHISTLHRWRLRGVRGVKLRTCLVGGIRYTTAEWLNDFIEATTEAADGEKHPTRTNRQRQAQIDKAKAELDAAGI